MAKSDKKKKGKKKRKDKLKISDANKIVPIQTREDRREGLRRNIDPKRYANPDSPDGRWPRHVV
tara:strand:- start:44 stop:235 length:192 start_codon:yes stop_codon:yes gene_type:complete